MVSFLGTIVKKNLIAIFEILRFAQNDSGERFFALLRMTQKAVTLSEYEGSNRKFDESF